MAWYKWADWLRLALCHSDTFMKNCGKRDWKKCAFTLSLLQSWKILSVSQYDVPAPLHWPWAQIPGRVCGPDTEITWFRKRARGIISKCCSWMSPRALVHQRPPACDYEGTRLGMGNVENGKPWKHHSFLTLHFPYFLWIWNTEVILTTCRWAPCCSQPKRMKGIGSAWWDADIMLSEEGALLTQRIHLEKKNKCHQGKQAFHSLSSWPFWWPSATSATRAQPPSRGPGQSASVAQAHTVLTPALRTSIHLHHPLPHQELLGALLPALSQGLLSSLKAWPASQAVWMRARCLASPRAESLPQGEFKLLRIFLS